MCTEVSPDTPNTSSYGRDQRRIVATGDVVSPFHEGSVVEISHFLSTSVDRLSKAEPGDIQEIAASQIALLTGYYELALGQARRSFRWALIAATVGLGFFISSVSFLLLRQSQDVAIISLISGALIEVISSINFYLYGKTSNQLSEFLTRLNTTQRFLLANSLCEGLENDFKQRARLNLINTIVKLDENKADQKKQIDDTEEDKKINSNPIQKK